MEAKWHTIELLDLRGNLFHDDEMLALYAATLAPKCCWRNLVTLYAVDLLSHSAWHYLLASGWLQLQYLSFTARWPTVGEDWVDCGAFLKQLDARLYEAFGLHTPALKHCHMYQPTVCPRLISSITTAWHAQLCSLHLVGGDICGESMQSFGEADWPNLQELDLQHTDVDAAAIRHVVRAKMPELQCLSLAQSSGMNAAAFAQLATSSWPKLQFLNLSRTLIPPGVLEGVDQAALDTEA